MVSTTIEWNVHIVCGGPETHHVSIEKVSLEKYREGQAFIFLRDFHISFEHKFDWVLFILLCTWYFRWPPALVQALIPTPVFNQPTSSSTVTFHCESGSFQPCWKYFYGHTKQACEIFKYLISASFRNKDSFLKKDTEKSVSAKKKQ